MVTELHHAITVRFARFLLVAVAVSACASTAGPSGAPTIRASDYDQTCATSDDCVAIYEGSLCAPCGCANAAIAKSATSTESTDARARAASCPLVAGISCGACWDSRLTCSGGRCGIVECHNGPCDDGGITSADAAADSP